MFLSMIMFIIYINLYKMGVVKQIDIKNRTFYSDMIKIKIFDAGLLKIDKKSFKSIGICNIGYIFLIKDD